MYSYTFDRETGGLLLNSTPTNFSKEPRPVYAQEMDLLGFAEYWQYETQNDTPYLWAESNTYWYRGEQIAKIRGGDLYHAPELTPVLDENGEVVFGKAHGEVLHPIDIAEMCKKNEALLTVLETTTVKLIVKEYENYKKKLDIFHVAFSGGKDSAVLLDLVKKALPRGSYVVIFGDTGMEFPDTYKAVEVTRRACEEDGTPFYIARSHFDPEESWKLFGPPARIIRWCCSVHKSTPQTLKMREIIGKDRYTGMDLVGVRKAESLARSKYRLDDFGKKQKGQYSFNPILEWTSAEIWSYIYANGIYINSAYKKGNARAGCLLCPMSGGQGDFFRRCSYKDEIDKFIGYIKESYNASSEAEKDTYLVGGGWNARTNGRDLINNPCRYSEENADGFFKIAVKTPSSNWQEWIKTIGTVTSTKTGYAIFYEDKKIDFTFSQSDSGYAITLDDSVIKENPKFGKLFRQVFKKSAYCIGCRVCETNCHHGSIKFENGQVSISDCIQCHQCHEIDEGCLCYRSLRRPKEGGNMKSLNSFADHAPKRDWLVMYFTLKERFFSDHTLGPMMYDKFRRFLKDAGLNSKNHFTPFAEMISAMGWETETALGLMMINLVMDNPQIEWYVKNFDLDTYYERAHVEAMLEAEEVKPKDAKSIVKSYKRIVDTPFGSSLNFGHATENSLVRTKWAIDDNRVILYALYRFVEKCNLGNDAEFHISYLFDEETERDGVSPVRMFGIYDEEEWKSILLGLSARYPEFINAIFTNDLKTISLRGKTSAEVLELFGEEL